MEPIMQFELTITPLLQSLGAGLTPVMKFFSFLGTENFFLAVIPLLLWCVDARLGIRIGIMLILTNSVKNPLKLAFHGPRPYWVDPAVAALAPESSFGVPSGHAQDAASLWGLLASSLRRGWVTVVAVFIILMIGLSRIYLGVHFTHDVIGGWAVGILLVLLFNLLEKPVSAWFNRINFGTKTLFALLVSAVIMLTGYLVRRAISEWTMSLEWASNATLQFPENPINPLEMEGFITIGGLAFGMLFGLALLALTGTKICAGGPLIKRAARYVLGLIILLAIYFGLRLFFPSEPAALAQVFRYVRYATVGAWVVFGAPWLFERLKFTKAS